LRDLDAIFDSLRADYPGFDTWIIRCKREQRRGWLIEAADGSYAGVCLVKDNEDPGAHGLRGRLVKLSTFKVSERHRGFRNGELLLKTALSYASTNRYDTVFVTVFPKHVETIRLLEDFGFRAQAAQTNLGEFILAKALTFSLQDYESLDPLEFHIRFGPSNLKVKGTTAFVVPIQPQYHDLLFPEAEQQQSLLSGRYPFGNSIRKAYLCNAQIRDLPAGSPLLFYRSKDQTAVSCIGVAESCLRSSDASQLARFVGKRTVYSLVQIEALCRNEVLAVLFRHSKVLDQPISLAELLRQELLKAAPQSIVTVPSEAMAWLRSRLER
jgi:L-amino acid N-acyltransferase YncA